jgi:23S rRNA (cytidine1920-2'-O)/16S rRNA (cytidine1409-2'-O)-methyltransferase
VILKEQFNTRHMVPAVFGVIEAGGSVGCLIKPQVELRREDITRGGIVRDPALHLQAVDKIRHFVTTEHHCEWRGLVPSPITGMDGNQEFLAWIRLPQPGSLDIPPPNPSSPPFVQ